jgi:hypothetical protein
MCFWMKGSSILFPFHLLLIKCVSLFIDGRRTGVWRGLFKCGCWLGWKVRDEALVKYSTKSYMMKHSTLCSSERKFVGRKNDRESLLKTVNDDLKVGFFSLTLK